MLSRSIQYLLSSTHWVHPPPPQNLNIPIIEAPWSRAAPVKLCTRCNKLSRDLAGLAGALVPLAGPLPKLNDKSGAFPVGWPIKVIIESIENVFVEHTFNCKLPGIRVGAGGGGIFGGPPPIGAPLTLPDWGNGCCWSGTLGSASSHSDDKSPELNLYGDNC